MRGLCTININNTDEFTSFHCSCKRTTGAQHSEGPNEVGLPETIEKSIQCYLLIHD